MVPENRCSSGSRRRLAGFPLLQLLPLLPSRFLLDSSINDACTDESREETEADPDRKPVSASEHAEQDGSRSGEQEEREHRLVERVVRPVVTLHSGSLGLRSQARARRP